MHHRCISLLAICALANLERSTAGVLVVDAAGAGPFTDLPAAITAAVHGDVLLMKSGAYTAAIVQNKALDIVAEIGASVVIHGTLTVATIPAGRALTITGVTLQGTSDSAPALHVLSNAGSIRIQGCTIRGLDQLDCPGQATPPYQLPGGHAVTVAFSPDVGITRSTLAGGRAGDDEFNFVLGGGTGLVVNSSSVALYETDATGGRGGSSPGVCGGFPFGEAGSGGRGAASSHGSIFVCGGSFVGGDAGVDWNGNNEPGDGILLAQSSTLIALDSSFAAGAHNPAGTVSIDNCVAPICPVGAPVQTVPGTARRFVATRLAREQGTVRFDFFGTPGDRVELQFAARGAFRLAAGGTGVELLERSKPNLVAQIGTIGPSGQLSTTWSVPELGAGVLGTRLFAQARFVETSGRALTGPPATIVLLDGSL